MPPRHIVHVVYSFRVGGLENGMVNLINNLPAERYRHTIVALTDADPVFCGRIRRQDVEVISLHKQPGHGVKLYPRMWKLFRALRPDVVHTRNLAALEMSVPAWAAGVPVRVHGEHGRDVDDPDGSNVRYQRVRRLYRPFVKQYIALSRELQSYLQGPVQVPDARIELICNGVDAERFHPVSPRAAVEGSPFNDPALWVIGTVGRVQAVKDHVGLVLAFAKLLRDGGDAAGHARLMIVGDGPLRGEVEAAARSEGVADKLWLTGERSDVPQLMQAMDCFTLPSLGEGISNTVLEAMACGLPVVASAVGGNPELVREGGTGALVPAAQPDALAAALLAYVRDPALARAHGRAGRARIDAEFSLTGMVARYDRLYQQLTTDKR
ncbi:MAG: TIGR03088 family PEP-CTERM/XrtA system glycosyltransferase [Moraxellaceae bacterium]|nr:TIGR03088 family PEP-CTERM/XrtA system glycosyltransferase [Moraxellaceae bacterium]